MFCLCPRKGALGRFQECGLCAHCVGFSSLSWALRARMELVCCRAACVITRTFSRFSLGPGGRVDYADTQAFFKRLRKAVEPSRVRFVGTEVYWPRTLRAACLDIVYGLWPDDVCALDGAWFSPLIQRCWHKGRISVAPVSPLLIDRVCGVEDAGAVGRPRFHASISPAIGLRFFESLPGRFRVGERQAGLPVCDPVFISWIDSMSLRVSA